MKVCSIAIGLILCFSCHCFGEQRTFKIDMEESMANGQGAICFSDGSKYVGHLIDGEIHGQGTIEFPDGSKYSGQFESGEIHGQGTMIFPDGSKYIGQFKNGMIHGQGTITFPDGSTYEGQFEDDKYHGEGTWSSPFGITYSGQFKAGKFDGQGIYSLPDGSRYVGLFKDDHFHGSGVWDRKKRSEETLLARQNTKPHSEADLPGTLSSPPVELESSVPDTVGKHEIPIPEDSFQRQDNPPAPSSDESIQEIPQVLETKGEDSGKTQAGDNSGQRLPPDYDTSIHTSSQLSFSVQVGAFLSRGNAERLVATLREKGYPSRMLTMLDYANKSWYTVRLGNYATLQEAKKEASDFSDKEKITATVRPVDAL